MKFVKKILAAAILGSLLLSFSYRTDNYGIANDNDPKKELKNFPEAKEGMVRYVIFLDKKSNEDSYKVELIPGKILNVDCNVYKLMGKTYEKEVDGWGYTYYEFSSDGKTLSTRMACPRQLNKDKFIPSESMLINYNSKLPIVIYAPKGYEVKYKIWVAGKENNSSIG